MAKKVKVGIFLVGGVALFCTGLFLIGSREHLFGNYFEVYTKFNDIDTLQTGAKVRVSGMDAGEITDVQVPRGPSGQFRLKLKVNQDLRPIIREDSVASIESEGMVGNKFVNIKKGSEKSPECVHCTLPSQESVSMGELIRQGKGIAARIQGTIQHVDGLILGVSPNIKRTASNSAKMTDNANALIAGIRQGHGAAGKLLTDDKLASNIASTVANAKQTSANIAQASEKVNTITSQVQRTELAEVHKTLENTRDMSHQLDQAVGTFLARGNSNEDTATALRETVHGAERATSNLTDDTEAIKHNFFFRGFFNRRGFYNFETMTPSKYAATRFVKKPQARVWVPAAGLFRVGAGDAQELTDIGRAILDQSMSELVPYLPNNPLVIEAYSTAGMPDRQYIDSRQRAIQVRKYLESRFHLKAERVGVMPFGAHPPKHAGKETWDGICLVLVVSKR